MSKNATFVYGSRLKTIKIGIGYLLFKISLGIYSQKSFWFQWKLLSSELSPGVELPLVSCNRISARALGFKTLVSSLMNA